MGHCNEFTLSLWFTLVLSAIGRNSLEKKVLICFWSRFSEVGMLVRLWWAERKDGSFPDPPRPGWVDRRPAGPGEQDPKQWQWREQESAPGPFEGWANLGRSEEFAGMGNKMIIMSMEKTETKSIIFFFSGVWRYSSGHHSLHTDRPGVVCFFWHFPRRPQYLTPSLRSPPPEFEKSYLKKWSRINLITKQ